MASSSPNSKSKLLSLNPMALPFYSPPPPPPLVGPFFLPHQMFHKPPPFPLLLHPTHPFPAYIAGFPRNPRPISKAGVKFLPSYSIAPNVNEGGKPMKMKNLESSMGIKKIRGMTKWVPKNSSDTGKNRAGDVSPPLPNITTLMIRNIPNKFRRGDLLKILDKHCQKENSEAVLRNDELKSEYDFVYLPIDFETNGNKGYGFVNFTNPIAAIRLRKSMHNFKWVSYHTKKICEIASAKIQGKDALTEHFRKRLFECCSDEYLPVILSPPRDGTDSTVVSPPVLVGRMGGR